MRFLQIWKAWKYGKLWDISLVLIVSKLEGLNPTECFNVLKKSNFSRSFRHLACHWESEQKGVMAFLTWKMSALYITYLPPKQAYEIFVLIKLCVLDQNSSTAFSWKMFWIKSRDQLLIPPCSELVSEHLYRSNPIILQNHNFIPIFLKVFYLASESNRELATAFAVLGR